MAKIGIIEDNLTLASRLAELLQTRLNLEVCLSSPEVEALFDPALQALPPDIILLDLNLNGKSSLPELPRIKATFPNSKVIITTSHTNPEFLMEAIALGADSYYIKGSDLNQLLQVVDIAIKGGTFLDPAAAPVLLDFVRNHRITNQSAGKDTPEQQWRTNGMFVPREIQIIEGLLEDMPYKEIAAKNNIGLNTVRHYVKSVYRKLQISRRADLRRLLGD
ncbi:MAG: response regulator [Haliscomenobacter sp.]